jgi:glycosyltransferase involved in cell wall biosynthesis
VAPKYSVVIPTLNRSQKLRRALDSVLNQPVDGELEIVVVDNCSDDDTQQVLAEPRYSKVRVIRQPVRVPQLPNLMTAFRSATGDYVSILFDDEEMLGENLLRKGNVLDEHPDVIAVTSSVTERDAEGNLRPGVLLRSQFTIEPQFEYLKNTFRSRTGGLPAFLMRRSAVEQLELEPRHEPLMDNAYILRLSSLGAIATFPEGFVTDTESDTEMMLTSEAQLIRNGMLEAFRVPQTPNTFVPLPGVWFYWCQFRVKVEYLMLIKNSLTKWQLRTLYRLARIYYRQGVWKAAYHRLAVSKKLGSALRFLAKAGAMDPYLLIPPVWFFIQWKLTDTSAPIPDLKPAPPTRELATH